MRGLYAMYQLLTPKGFYTVNLNCSNYPNKMTSTTVKIHDFCVLLHCMNPPQTGSWTWRPLH